MEELKASLDQVEEALIQKQEEVTIIKLVVGRMLTTHTFPLSLSLTLTGRRIITAAETGMSGVTIAPTSSLIISSTLCHHTTLASSQLRNTIFVPKLAYSSFLLAVLFSGVRGDAGVTEVSLRLKTGTTRTTAPAETG